MPTKKIILVVEDDVVLQKVFTRLFTSHGFIVISAGSRRQATEILHGQDPIDLVVSDTDLGDGSGYELHRDLPPHRHNLPWLATSGNFEDQHEALKYYVDHRIDMIGKPFALKAIFTIINRLLSRAS